MGGCFVLTLLVLIVDGVFGDEVKTVTVMEGDSVTLNSNVTKQQPDKIRWYFNDTLIAYINGDPSKSCLYDGKGGIFRDSLKVDDETGSLTITRIRSEHTGRYELEFNRRDGTGTSGNLNRNITCDRTQITRKPIRDEDIIKSFSVILADAEKKALQRADDMSSAQSPAGKAGIFVGVVAVAVVLLV